MSFNNVLRVELTRPLHIPTKTNFFIRARRSNSVLNPTPALKKRPRSRERRKITTKKDIWRRRDLNSPSRRPKVEINSSRSAYTQGLCWCVSGFISTLCTFFSFSHFTRSLCSRLPFYSRHLQSHLRWHSRY